MKSLSLNDYTLTYGTEIKAIRRSDFWDFDGTSEKRNVTLKFVEKVPLRANGALWEGNYDGYSFVDDDCNTIILCPLNSWGNNTVSVYGNCIGKEGYQLVGQPLSLKTLLQGVNLMDKRQLMDDIVDCYEYLMSAYEPTNHCIDTTLSKCSFYQEQYGEDESIEKMAQNIYNKFYK